MNLKKLVTICLGISVSQIAWADIDIIGGIGGTSYEYDVNSGSATNIESQSLGGSTTFRLGVAMNINDWFRLEGLYVDYGTAKTGYTFGSSTGTTEVFDYEMKPKALEVQALASYSLSQRYSVFGKVGVSSWRFSTNSSFVRTQGGSVTSNLQFSGSDSGVDPLYGIGIERKLDSGSYFRADYEKLTLRSVRDIRLRLIGFSYIYPIK